MKPLLLHVQSSEHNQPCNATNVTNQPPTPHTMNGGNEEAYEMGRRRMEGKRDWVVMEKGHIEIPEFVGKAHPDDFIDWLSTVERIFDLRDIFEKLKVKLVAIKLRKSASLSSSLPRSTNLRVRCPLRFRLTVCTIFDEMVKETEDLVKFCTVIIDGGSCDNMVATSMVEKLGLDVEDHLVKRRKCPQVVTKANPVAPPISVLVQPLMSRFQDVFPDDISPGLPQMRDIQHCINFLSGSTIPNKPAYRMNTKEFDELHKQVTELLDKGLIHESMTPCAVPALLVPKHDGCMKGGKLKWTKEADNAFTKLKNESHKHPFLVMPSGWNSYKHICSLSATKRVLPMLLLMHCRRHVLTSSLKVQ
nr:reverse transcriptase domain-containing protein [Tanacetum cinerariifolium]